MKPLWLSSEVKLWSALSSNKFPDLNLIYMVILLFILFLCFLLSFPGCSWSSGDFFTAQDTSQLITWQDGRCSNHFLSSLPKPNSHLSIATGFGCATIFWYMKFRLAHCFRSHCILEPTPSSPHERTLIIVIVFPDPSFLRILQLQGPSRTTWCPCCVGWMDV